VNEQRESTGRRGAVEREVLEPSLIGPRYFSSARERLIDFKSRINQREGSG